MVRTRADAATIVPMPSATPLSLTLADLAALLGAELRGDPAAIVHGIAGIKEAAAGDVTFVSNPRYAALARTTKATAVLVEPDFAAISAATLRLKNPYLAFARVLELFHRPLDYRPGVDPTAVVALTAKIGSNAHIGAYAVLLDHVVVGDDAVILPHVVLYPHVRIGDRFFAHAHAVVREYCQLGNDVLLQNGAIIGADGFGFARQHGPSPVSSPVSRPVSSPVSSPVSGSGSSHEGRVWHKIPQSGPAILEDRVEVQANACIDRATIGETRIGAGTKVDNLVQVGHGSSVGKDTLLCAQAGLAGSSTVGSNVILAGQVGVVGHSVIGDGAVVTAQSGVPSDVAAGATVSGYPAFDTRQWRRSAAIFKRLPEIVRELRLSRKE